MLSRAILEKVVNCNSYPSEVLTTSEYRLLEEEMGIYLEFGGWREEAQRRLKTLGQGPVLVTYDL
jgi:hypothetical protein